MIIKFGLVRLSIIFLLVILFPLVQKQWLNLYLFDIDNFTIYKFLYYFSGVTVPIFIIFNSLNKFTYYKFNYHKSNHSDYISGKFLLFISLVLLITLSILTAQYFFINLKLLFDIFISNDKFLVHFEYFKQPLFIFIISILLILKKTKFIIKKIILINFFLISIFIWYSQINNSFLIDKVSFNIIKFENANFSNTTFLLAIETIFYLWSYISFDTYLSDWIVPKPHIKEFWPIINILIFYFLIFLYYSILSYR